MTDQPTPVDFRALFPTLTDTTHLASCSQAAMSDALTGQLLEFQHTLRAYGAPWGLWMEQVAVARRLFAQLIGADEDNIAVLSTASEGAFHAASTQDWSSRPRLVTNDLEFPSVAHNWLAQESRGAEVVFVDHHDGLVDVEDYAAEIDERTQLVSVPLVSYANGVRFPVKEVVALAHERGAKVFVDGYQGVGAEPVDVRDLGCDYLVSGSLKYLLGIPGIAFLYVRPDLVDDVPPPYTGWFGRRDPFEFDPRNLDRPEHARRFENGTPSIPSAYGAVAGLQTLMQVDAAMIREHISTLGGCLQDELLDRGERLFSPVTTDRRGPMVALRDPDPLALSEFLASRRIVTSPRGEVVRLSFHYYNNAADVDTLVAAIDDYRAR